MVKPEAAPQASVGIAVNDATTPATPPVAVIDDDIKFIRMLERALGTHEIPILPVTTLDIDEAVRVIEDAGCRAAVVDVFMYGDALGFSLVEKLRERPTLASLPIIVSSGARREIGRKVNFLQDQRCSVLLKPFDINELVARINGAPEPAEPAESSALPAARLPALSLLTQPADPTAGGTI